MSAGPKMAERFLWLTRPLRPEEMQARKQPQGVWGHVAMLTQGLSLVIIINPGTRVCGFKRDTLTF